MLKVLCVVNGYLEENCYIIHNEKKALIVDPGSDEVKIVNALGNLEVVGILVTHYHDDHTQILDSIKSKYKVKVFDYKSEENIKIDEFQFKKIENYGHTMDSVSFYFEDERIMFTGDFVFKGTIGNYDIENEGIMIDSLKRFKLFSDDITIYPGHGSSSSVGYEKKHNYFLRGL